MDSKKIRKILEERLSDPERIFKYDREKDRLRIENKKTGQGITIELPGIVSKWQNAKEKAIDEAVYYVTEGLNAMEEKVQLSGQERNIFPVIRSTSFPKEVEEDVPLLFDEHTAETRIYYALDRGKNYRLIDKRLLESEGWNEERVKEAALFNIRSLSTEFKMDEVAGNLFYFLNTNDGYDASRILNESLLNKMSQEVKGDFVVAVPHQDVLILADVRNSTGYDILAQMTMSFFTAGTVPITALSFLYENGKLEPIFILGKNKSKK